MNPDLHEFLKSCDVKDAWEFPPGSDWVASIAEVEMLKPEIERLIGNDLRLDKGVQDASFFADLGLLNKRGLDDGIIYLSYRICFRFSWFGRMFTVMGDDWRGFDVASLIGFLEGNGYKYVPCDEIDVLYDGVNEPYEEGLTWWVRYFDYL